jgi:predicted RNase H-like HicB family nuclease
MTTALIEAGGEFPTLTNQDLRASGYLVVLERGDTSWGAYVPDLPGVIAVGGTEEEVRSLIDEAVEFHLEGMAEEGIPIPSPASRAWRVAA